MAPSGGYYFIPNMNMPKWEKVKNAVRIADCCAMDRYSQRARFISINFAIDEDSIEAIQYELEDEMKRTTAELVEAASGKPLTGRALANRVAQTEEMLEKVQKYEKSFGKSLDTCRDSIAQIVTVLTNDSSVKEDDEVYGDLFAVE